MRALLCLLVLAALAPAPASAGSLFFDFEDGTTQGWEPNRSFLRDDFAIGGQFAVFAVDGGSLSMTLDVGELEAIVLERRFTYEGPSFPIPNLPPLEVTEDQFISVRLRQPGRVILIGTGTPIGDGDRDLRLYDLSGVSGEWTLRIAWERFVRPEEDFTLCFEDAHAGYVDNIRFIPVPEPAAVGMLVGAFGVLVRVRRRASGAR